MLTKKLLFNSYSILKSSSLLVSSSSSTLSRLSSSSSSFNTINKINKLSYTTSSYVLNNNEKEIRFNHRAGPAIAYLISQGLSGAQIEAILDAYPSPPTLSEIRALGDDGLIALIKSVDRQIKEKEEQLKKILEKQQEKENENNNKKFTKLVKKTPKTASNIPKTITIKVKPNNLNESFDLPLRIGANLFEEIRYHPALKNSLPGTCGGQAACSTCHIYLIPPEYNDDELPPLMDEPDDKELYAKIIKYEKIESPKAYEEDMLDLCADSRPGASRLSCQITITPELNNYRLILPDTFVDLY